MTGFGTAKHEDENTKITVEVKSLNSKFNDTNVRFPKILSEKELEIRNLVSKALGRGKISVQIEVTQESEDNHRVTINSELATAYYNDVQAFAESVNSSSDAVLRFALGLPGVMEQPSKAELDGDLWNKVSKTLDEAIKKCIEFRKQEGDVTQKKFEECIGLIGDNLNQIAVLDRPRVDKIKDRIRTNLESVLSAESIDQNRYEQELIYYIEKIDINEEKLRLQNHLDYFNEVMNQGDSNGKKLGFISQEIGREVNTIGSKANDSGLQKLVVDMKDALEQIKEQVANIL
jgi:uncharacterized protein (TIGR00255 family)